MASEYAPRGLVGLLTPQANTTAEPEFSVLLPPGYAAVNARLVSTRASMDARLLDYFEGLEAAAAQFADAPLAALAFACTGASYLAGRLREEAAVQAIGQRRGVPVVTAGLAVVQALRELGAWRIALCSPYPAGLAQASVAYWESHGLQVVALASPRPPAGGGHPIYGLRSADAGPVLDELQGAHADAIVMLGTGMPSLAALLQRRGGSGVPVLSCMLCLAWSAVRAIEPADADLRAWLAAGHWAAAHARATGLSPPAAR